MKTKHIIILKLARIDKLQEEIDSLKKHQQSIRFEVSQYKKSIEEEAQHMIGKSAMCAEGDESKFKECICTKVVCTDQFEVRPLFRNKLGKKVSVDYYNWV